MNHNEKDKNLRKLTAIKRKLEKLKECGVFNQTIYKVLNKFIVQCQFVLTNNNKKSKSGFNADTILRTLITIQLIIERQNTTPNTIKFHELTEYNQDNRILCFGLLTEEFEVDISNLNMIDTMGAQVENLFTNAISTSQSTLNVTTTELHNLYFVYCVLKDMSTEIRDVSIGIKNQRTVNDNIAHMLYQMELILNRQDEQERVSQKNEKKAIEVEKRIYANLMEIGALLIAVVGFISFNLSAVTSKNFDLSSLFFINFILIVGVSILMMMIAIVLYRNGEGIKKALIMFLVMVVMLAVMVAGVLVAYPHLNDILL